ncbi:hypothetical protein [Dyadobacter sp. 676]|uniref:Uncharacterized protein n=1 Tax=Dyadobacter sp. 676 TaxID=3088362 RepID=A0AAU8FK25_9BACT
MASVPIKGDRLMAKVELTSYSDKECTKMSLPIPPGPGGYKKSFQFPAKRATGDEVGVYTGNSSDVGYEVEMVWKWRAGKPGIPWKYFDAYKFVTAWVKKDQVTGYWDQGVDSPLNDPKNPINTPPPQGDKDNTNTYLLLAVGAGLFFKFVAPKLKGNGKN